MRGQKRNLLSLSHNSTFFFSLSLSSLFACAYLFLLLLSFLVFSGLSFKDFLFFLLSCCSWLSFLLGFFYYYSPSNKKETDRQRRLLIKYSMTTIPTFISQLHSDTYWTKDTTTEILGDRSLGEKRMREVEILSFTCIAYCCRNFVRNSINGAQLRNHKHQCSPIIEEISCRKQHQHAQA